MSLIKEIAELAMQSVEKIVVIADKYGEDRDAVMQRYVFLLNNFEQVSTLKKYEVQKPQ